MTHLKESSDQPYRPIFNADRVARLYSRVSALAGDDYLSEVYASELSDPDSDLTNEVLAVVALYAVTFDAEKYRERGVDRLLAYIEADIKTQYELGINGSRTGAFKNSSARIIARGLNNLFALDSDDDITQKNLEKEEIKENEPVLDIERVELLFDYLEKKGLISRDNGNIEEKWQLLQKIPDDFVKKSHALHGENSTGISRDTGRAMYLRRYINGADNAEIIAFLRARGRMVPNDLDKLALTELDFYVRLNQNIDPSAKIDVIDPMNPEFPSEAHLDLHSTIKSLMEKGAIEPSNAGKIMLLFGKVSAPKGTPQPVIDMVKQQAAVELRSKTAVEIPKDIDVISRLGMSYLRMILGRNMSSFQSPQAVAANIAMRSDEVASDSSKAISENVKIIESAVSHALNYLYQAQRESAA